MTVYFIGAGPGAPESCQEKWAPLFRFGSTTTKDKGAQI